MNIIFMYLMMEGSVYGISDASVAFFCSAIKIGYKLFIRFKKTYFYVILIRCRFGFPLEKIFTRHHDLLFSSFLLFHWLLLAINSTPRRVILFNAYKSSRNYFKKFDLIIILIVIIMITKAKNITIYIDHMKNILK